MGRWGGYEMGEPFQKGGDLTSALQACFCFEAMFLISNWNLGNNQNQKCLVGVMEGGGGCTLLGLLKFKVVWEFFSCIKREQLPGQCALRRALWYNFPLETLLLLFCAPCCTESGHQPPAFQFRPSHFVLNRGSWSAIHLKGSSSQHEL